MAKDVASRCSSDDASAEEARERIERAAAQFASIHDRWSALSADTVSLDPSPPADALSNETARAGDAPGTEEPGAAGVSVTPILGIDAVEKSAPRPRFKTLLGVPRNSPDIDALALEFDPGRRRDTVRLERPAQRPPTPPPKPAAAPSASKDEPSLAATSWPYELSAPALPLSPRAVPAQWPALVESSLEVSEEVAALRAASGRRHWFAGWAAVAAVLALFAVAAPRERTLALRWLRQEVQARVHPSVAAITDTARSLRPTGNVTPPSSPAESQDTPLPAVAARHSSEFASAGATPGVEGSNSAPLLAGHAASSPPAPEVAPLTAPATEGQSMATTGTASPAPAEEDARAPATPSSTGLDGKSSARLERKIAAPAPRAAAHDALNTTGNTSKVRQQVAAPRKRKQHPAGLATPATKPRATPQNPPRKDTGGGIIRETPF